MGGLYTFLAGLVCPSWKGTCRRSQPRSVYIIHGRGGSSKQELVIDLETHPNRAAGDEFTPSNPDSTYECGSRTAQKHGRLTSLRTSMLFICRAQAGPQVCPTHFPCMSLFDLCVTCPLPGSPTAVRYFGTLYSWQSLLHLQLRCLFKRFSWKSPTYHYRRKLFPQNPAPL